MLEFGEYIHAVGPTDVPRQVNPKGWSVVMWKRWGGGADRQPRERREKGSNPRREREKSR